MEAPECYSFKPQNTSYWPMRSLDDGSPERKNRNTTALQAGSVGSGKRCFSVDAAAVQGSGGVCTSPRVATTTRVHCSVFSRHRVEE